MSKPARAGDEPTRRPWRWLLLLLVSLAFHAAAVLLGIRYAPDFSAVDVPIAVHFIDGDPLDALSPEQWARLEALEAAIVEEPEEEEEEEPEPEPSDGQVVETAPPTEEKIPLKSEYLAEHNNAVPEETRSERYKMNPEVTSNVYSKESKLEFEDLLDVGAKEKSSGATVGSLSPPEAGQGAPRSAIPSPWALTNKEGLAAPSASSSRTQSLAGAPQNDLLDEKNGSAVALNTREFAGAAYINRIKRQVNFYWRQNLDNLPSSARMSKPRYATVVDVVLNGDGALESIVVADESGSNLLDICVVDAFRAAGPFPNPPAPLIARDGRVYLADLDFEVHLGHAQMPYQGIDPRSGVQFPGIMKQPR